MRFTSHFIAAHLFKKKSKREGRSCAETVCDDASMSMCRVFRASLPVLSTPSNNASSRAFFRSVCIAILLTPRTIGVSSHMIKVLDRAKPAERLGEHRGDRG
jgi:hypothetical protein